MPNLDKTGPAGQGPLTGRGQGPCNENQRLNQGFFGRCFGRGFWGGFGRGRGGGFGRGPGFFQEDNSPISLEEEEKMLKNRLEAISKAKKNSSTKKK